MYQRIEQRLTQLIDAGQAKLLIGGKIGLEKETLRATPNGMIAQTPHPHILGSPFTHPWITTDFSEALIEFVTPPMDDISEALTFLCNTQRFVYNHVDGELLWGTSMPCMLTGDESIRIAHYGSSNAGKMKHIYRVGLSNRYGRAMQVIAGVHFNFSFDENLWPVFQALEQNSQDFEEFRADAYFGMIRNLQRYGWLIPYLFGASPAVCKTFIGEAKTDMVKFDSSTYYYPFATSLRMGDIGYQNNRAYETGFKACYDTLESYVESLTYAISRPCPCYEQIGVRVNGEYRQLNANMLQIENEYYSTVRPKQLPNNNEKPSLALRDRGIQYIELRSLDVNAYDPLGINEQQLLFLEAFMIFCLLQESPVITAAEAREIDFNENQTAHQGRDPQLKLRHNGRSISLKQWATDICHAMHGICETLDSLEEDSRYHHTFSKHLESVKDPDNTPSARMLQEMRETKEGFYEFARRMSEQHHEYFNKLSLSNDQISFYTELAKRSHAQQLETEIKDKISFEQYMERYYSQN